MIHWAEGRFFITLAFFLILQHVWCQEPKPPEAVDDFAITLQGGLVTIPVLLNDFSEDGHPVQVILATGIR